MSNIENEIKDRIRTTFKSFFMHTIEHLTKSDPDFNDYLQVVFSLQESLELMVKYFLIETYGYRNVINKKQCTCSDEQNENLLNSNQLKTKNYSDLLEILETKEALFDSEENELIRLFQQIRNQIVHMGVKIIDKTIINKTITLIVKVFSNLDYKEMIENQSGAKMENLLKNMIGEDLYNKLLERTDIINQTSKYALSNYACVHYCLECENETVIETEDGLQCLLCGYKTESYFSTVIICPNCDTDNLYVDALNTTESNNTNGHCACCGSNLEVSRCENCGNFFPVCFPCGCGKHI